MMRVPAFRITSLFDGLVTLECSNGQTLATADYNQAFDFLTNQPSGIPASVPRVVWSLNDMVRELVPLLPPAARSFNDKTDRNAYQATWSEGGYRNRIFFQVGKFFSINRRQEGVYGDKEVNFYELDQFYPEEPAIDTAQDVKALADRLIETFHHLGISQVDNLNSPVAVIEASGLLEKTLRQLPDPGEIPAGCKEYAIYSDAYGAWASAYQVGYWPECYGADIASCYPSIAAKLKSLDGARFEYSKTVLDDAVYGFVKGKLTINPDHPYAFCSPIVHPLDADILGNPTGELNDYFTLGQIRYATMYGLGSFEIDKRAGGWFVYPRADADKPLASVMSHYYARRADGDLSDLVCKRVIAGIIGKLGQFKGGEATEYTNPVYHSYIRSTASLLVGKYLIEQEITPDELLYVNTDGFYSTRAFDLPERAERMGSWRQKKTGLLVLSPDDFAQGENAKPVLDAFNGHKQASDYPDVGIDMLTLRLSQNRYFEQFPSTGGELLRKHYKSEAVQLDK